MKRRDLKLYHRVVLLIFLAGVAIAFIRWHCVSDPRINFLPSDGRADWIFFPAAVDAGAHDIATLDTSFRRELTLDTTPKHARLIVRGAKRFELKINGAPLEITVSGNWKDVSSIDVSGALREGENLIEARVFNDNGPPALWLALSADQLTLRSDQTWEASCAGSSWRRAMLASNPRFPGPGNAIAGGERTFDSFIKVWPLWMGFAGIAVVICIIGRLWLRRVQASPAAVTCGFSNRQMVALLVFVATLWIFLFSNNLRFLPYHVGFDFPSHRDYIKYIQTRRALPLPNEGYEMFQPPLYYAVSAAALSLCGLSVTDASSVFILRGLTMLFGIAQFTLVFLCLRLLFPRQIGRQLVGLTLAAFLPMQLYLSHYVTNETLAATLITAAVYLCLRVLMKDSASVWQYLGLGLCIGAAILTKATGALLLPVTLYAIAVKLTRTVPKRKLAFMLRDLGVMLAACFIVCGWHYIRIWHRFGTPLVGNWDIASGFAWWQDPGYRMSTDYARIGRSLIDPLFSGLNGFLDGIYSTLWGDGLCGGSPDFFLRPPWNYNLIAAGYLLAVVPTVLILIGAGVAVRRFVQTHSGEWIMLLGLSAAVGLGVIFMTLKVPSHAQIKAFYGLSILVPLCCFGAIGWDVLTRRYKPAQFAIGAILIVWAANSFASVWILDSAPQHLFASQRLSLAGQTSAGVAEAVKAIKAEPNDPNAARFLASALDKLGSLDDALHQAEVATELGPADSEAHVQLSMILAKQGRFERAISEAHRALELGPENSYASNVLLVCLRQSNRNREAIDVARDALAISPFDAELHYEFGLAAAKIGDFATSANQFAYALLLRPKWQAAASNIHTAVLALASRTDGSPRLHEAALLAPDSPKILSELAWVLATNPDERLRDGKEAMGLSEHACAISERKMPAPLSALAAAYAEMARFSDAIKTAEEALSLSKSVGNSGAVILNENLLISFRDNLPYRQEVISR